MGDLLKFEKKDPKPEVTVCLRCAHFKNLDPSSGREHIWYNHVCMANPLPLKVDPYDGKEKPCGVNDLGGEYFSKQPYQFCRNINDGKCPKFQALDNSKRIVGTYTGLLIASAFMLYHRLCANHSLSTENSNNK